MAWLVSMARKLHDTARLVEYRSVGGGKFYSGIFIFRRDRLAELYSITEVLMAFGGKLGWDQVKRVASQNK